MALYFYQAFTKDGKKVSGNFDAGSAQAVRDHLAKNGLFPATIVLATTNQPQNISFFKRLFAPKVTDKDKIFLTKQLAVLLKAGVPLLEALELLIEQTEGGLRTIVIELKDGIKEGKSLADGLSKYPRVFDTTYVQLVRAGEASGRLEIILERLTDYIQRSLELKKKVKGALMLPMIQMGIVILVVAILFVFVVPQIAEAFMGQGVELPLPTRIVVGISDFLVNNYIMLIILFISTISLFMWWKSTASGSRIFDTIKLKLPMVGHFTKMSAIVQFCQTLGMLLEGGVNLPESLDIVCKIVDNKILVTTLQEARENIIRQGRMAEYLKKTGLFPPVAIYLISTGEKSGQLDAMLLTVAHYYETELRDLADSLAAKLGPAMMVVMGIIVGFVVIAIGKPIMDMANLAEGGAQYEKL